MIKYNMSKKKLKILITKKACRFKSSRAHFELQKIMGTNKILSSDLIPVVIMKALNATWTWLRDITWIRLSLKLH